jgi:hypothetical protein
MANPFDKLTYEPHLPRGSGGYKPIVKAQKKQIAEYEQRMREVQGNALKSGSAKDELVHDLFRHNVQLQKENAVLQRENKMLALAHNGNGHGGAPAIAMDPATTEKPEEEKDDDDDDTHGL